MPDGELLDEIGYTLYARCLQGREERALVEVGKLKCHHCGAILPYSNGLMQCECGYQYFFRDYMRSFRANNMPSGAATHIFNEFIDKWPGANADNEKMRWIDWLIREFHSNLLTGVKGRFVGVNLIEGTKRQIQTLITDLAYGSAEKNNRESFLQIPDKK